MRTSGIVRTARRVFLFELALVHRLAHRQRADVEVERAPGNARSSPTRKPVAPMRLTIVRYGSSTCLSSFASTSPAIIAGFFFNSEDERVGVISSARADERARNAHERTS